MSKPDNHIDVGAILRHYREFADLAWSEVTDKVHTVEEYHEALERLTKDHAQLIEDFYRNKILEAERNLLRQLCWDGMDEDTGNIKNGYVGSLAKSRLKELDVDFEIDWLYSLEEKLQHDRQNNITAQPIKETLND